MRTLSEIRDAIYILLIFSIVLSISTYLKINDPYIRWLIYLEENVLTITIPFAAFSVWLFGVKEKAFISYLIVRLLDIPSIVTILYDSKNSMSLYGIQLRYYFESLMIIGNLITIYFIYKHFKKEFNHGSTESNAR